MFWSAERRRLSVTNKSIEFRRKQKQSLARRIKNLKHKESFELHKNFCREASTVFCTLRVSRVHCWIILRSSKASKDDVNDYILFSSALLRFGCISFDNGENEWVGSRLSLSSEKLPLPKDNPSTLPASDKNWEQLENWESLI